MKKMNPTDSLMQNRKLTIRRWLPYFIIAAILINIGALATLIDIINIATSSISSALGLGFIIPIPVVNLENLRTFGNAVLIVALVLVAIRSTEEK